jgi:hypothetical protein
MTPLQKQMLRSIARSDFTIVNGCEPVALEEVSWVWANTVIETPEDKGVFTSLLNAGLVEHNGLKGRDACITLTAAGFAAYKEQA